VSDILLITISHNQFKENILNINCDKLDKFDRNRMITKNHLSEHFNIKLYEEQTNYFSISKAELISRIENKYISSLQILTDSELNELIYKINSSYPEVILYPDFYTYILINNK
jgi:hypothetical protein